MPVPKPPPRAADVTRPAGEGDTPEPGAALFVGCVWATMLSAAVGFVAAFGADVPVSEDFGYVPVLTGERPLTVGWLWSWVNEFRFPLTKLVLVAAFKLTGLDFRAGLFLSVASLGLLALGLILAARRVRGGTRYTDAFFPLACLNWGHHTCFLWNSAFVFVCSTVLGAGFLLLVVRRGGRPSTATASAASAGFSLLPLVGPMGLAFMPALAIWIGVGGGVPRALRRAVRAPPRPVDRGPVGARPGPRRAVLPRLRAPATPLPSGGAGGRGADHAPVHEPGFRTRRGRPLAVLGGGRACSRSRRPCS